MKRTALLQVLKMVNIGFTSFYSSIFLDAIEKVQICHSSVDFIHVWTGSDSSRRLCDECKFGNLHLRRILIEE
jgi:hypothetical protein